MVTFYKLDDRGFPQFPVLYLDTLKVSTIEQTADEATANGGKGNPPLVIWDYNKDITVTLEDALFSAKSLAIMFGDGTLKPIATDSGEQAQLIMKTEMFVCKKGGAPDQGEEDTGWSQYYTDPNGKKHEKINPKFFNANGEALGGASGAGAADLVVGTKYFCSYDLAVDGYAVEISADSFPGTYYVTGDTYARSDVNGEDEFFQFIIPKAKVQSENTITLEADGDPSTFNMSLHVMRPENGKMMMLVKYKTTEGTKDAPDTTADIYHNHYLDNVTDGKPTGDRNTGDGELRIKTKPIRASYAFANIDALDGVELEQYSATSKAWTKVTATISAYKVVADDDDVQITAASQIGTDNIEVYYMAAGNTHKTPTITILGAPVNTNITVGD